MNNNRRRNFRSRTQKNGFRRRGVSVGSNNSNTFQNNALTIVPNGSQKIGGTAANASLSTEGQSVTLVYVDDTEGWKNVQDSTSNVTGEIEFEIKYDNHLNGKQKNKVKI